MAVIQGQSLQVAVQAKANASPAHCMHCRQELASGMTSFCCRGCEVAYNLIQGMGLEQFYELATDAPLGPVEEHASARLSYLDSSAFQNSLPKKSDKRLCAKVDVKGLSCYACVWLIESAVRKLNASIDVNVNLSLGTAEIEFEPANVRLSQIAKLIEKLGYKVSVGTQGASYNQQDVLRLGVAWFCFMNVMAIAFADYMDFRQEMEPLYAQLFRWLSFALTVPAVIYSGRIFYTRAWDSLRQRRVSIDQPISISIFTVFAYSVYNTIIGTGPVYFDSVCSGIALLLSARFFQQRILTKAQSEIRQLVEPAEKFVRLSSDAGESIVPLTSLRKGDKFKVFPGEWISVSASVDKGSGAVNLESLTGEPKWQDVKETSNIPSGAFNGGSSLILVAEEDGKNSYWQNMNSAVDELLATKGRMKEFSDRAAFIFLFLVNGLAISLFAYFFQQGDMAEGARRAFALALIACPCAFGLTAPLIFSACAAKGLRRGIVFKSQKAIENLAVTKRIIFDKTGTLTDGKMNVAEVQWQKEYLLNKEGQRLALSILREMTESSAHPASLAIKNWLKGLPTTLMDIKQDRVVEVFGSGLSLFTGDGVYRLGRATFALGNPRQEEPGGSEVFFSFQHQLIARFILEDHVLPEARAVVNAFQRQNFSIEILSGDSTSRTEAVAKDLGLTGGIHGNALPEDKAAKVRGDKGSAAIAMVGNGMNDSLAMAEASVSIAVANSMSASRHAADICLSSPGLRPCLQAFALAKASQRAFRRGMLFAFSYNTLGILLAIAGLVTPGVAAALMPLSSLCIVALATKWREPDWERGLT